MAAEATAIVRMAVDLTRSLGATDRYARLLRAVRAVVPCDATALLALHGDELVPLATHGLMPQVLGMRFRLDDHPRLARIVASPAAVRFAAESSLPDPFDGLVEGAPDALSDVHDCLGCPLVVDDEVVGALTADALDADAFAGLDRDVLAAVGALAGAALHTTRLIETVERLAEKRGLVVRELTRDLAGYDSSHILGVSDAVDQLRREIETVAPSDLAVLVVGETGVGKELAARAIHAASNRHDGPLVYVNCAALPESIVESELFGHLKGSFTGATGARLGKFEVADGGTLFLDEIGELPLSVQPKLLRALQEGEIQRVGSDRGVRVDVRIVAATNRVLEDEVEAGRFRADLFHRLNVYPLRVPPLRERPEDIGVLAGHFLDRYRSRFGVRQMVLGTDTADALRARPWPGNVRELDHCIARAALRAATRVDESGAVQLVLADFDLAAEPARSPTPSEALVRRSAGGELALRDAVDEFKRRVVEQALERADGNWSEAARALGVHRSNLHHLARRLDIDGPRKG